MESRALQRVMPLVVKLERGAEADPSQVLAAAGTAVAMVLASPAAAEGGEWHEQIQAWAGGRIRKVVRRARGAEWERVAALPGVSVCAGTAAVRAFPPTRVDEVPADIGRLQVAGLDLPGVLPVRAAPTDGQLVVALNPEVTATTGKWAAQVGHAAQLTLARLSATDRATWAAAGFRVVVIAPAAPQFTEQARRAPVVVHDGGFTEVAPGTLMAVAHYVGPG